MKISFLSLLCLFLCASAASQRLVDKAIIGITASKAEHGRPFAPAVYAQAVRMAGGEPLVLGISTDEAAVRKMIEGIDALVLTGGEDIDPAYYGEQPHPRLGRVTPWRDSYDLLLIRLAVERGMPVLAVCRGIQVLNVAFGGSLWQDIPSQMHHALPHMKTRRETAIATHTITVAEGSMMRKLLCCSDITVNSAHHQSVKRLAPGFRAIAFAPDGVVEGIEMFNRRVTGVQFHPERMMAAGDEHMLPLFVNLVGDARMMRATLSHCKPQPANPKQQGEALSPPPFLYVPALIN